MNQPQIRFAPVLDETRTLPGPAVNVWSFLPSYRVVGEPVAERQADGSWQVTITLEPAEPTDRHTRA